MHGSIMGDPQGARTVLFETSREKNGLGQIKRQQLTGLLRQLGKVQHKEMGKKVSSSYVLWLR